MPAISYGGDAAECSSFNSTHFIPTAWTFIIHGTALQFAFRLPDFAAEPARPDSGYQALSARPSGWIARRPGRFG